MGLFDKFNETIFYKKDSELELQIEALKKIQKEYPNNDIIAHKLKICELGLKGEKEIEFELKNSNIGMYVLHDVNLNFNDLKAQIDYFVITPAYIYCIECKNLIGNITINNRGEFIREYQYGNKKVKEGIYSPLRQSERHIEVFKKIWKSKNNSIIDKTLRKNMIDNWYKPLVVMANSKNILNMRYAPKEIKEKVIKSDSLINYIKNDIANTEKEYLSNKKQLHNIAYSIMQNYNQDINRDYEQELRDWIKKESNSEINKKVKNNEVSNIRNRLIEYRKNKSKEKNIPAYYIFNNEELEKIVYLLPTDLEELKNSKILSDIKLKLHGKEIIEIINN